MWKNEGIQVLVASFGNNDTKDVEIQILGWLTGHKPEKITSRFKLLLQ